jgi:alkanesulfonate monooxygenase SsuD/methylene tetrahydromethanopterin reductase-like flavin-dependent oxidoreductase (luciferase family)
MMRRGVVFTPMETRRKVIVEVAVLADSLGYEVVALPEAWGLDSTVVLTEIAVKTDRIRPMSAILSVWGRSPATIAMHAATLGDVSAGRYILGLGASTSALVEGLHDTAFEQPAQRLAQVTNDVRMLLAGERANLHRVADARPLRLATGARPGQQIVIAAGGPRTRRVAAELGDGWYPVFLARDRFADQVNELRDLRGAAGRDPASFTVFANPFLGVDQDLGAARSKAASFLAWYLVAMGDVYGRHVAGQGFEQEVAAVRDANPHPKPNECVIPTEADALLDQFAVIATRDTLSEQLEPWDQLADVTLVGMVPGVPLLELLDIVHAAAPT